ncbi:MAG: PQQ-binding-like beta-propeller repeat protein [Planctomycetaceae bacterium]|nr:PQQ-binding-like beta-propeller repeat protein [Planctomycetaceae bacterium]
MSIPLHVTVASVACLAASLCSGADWNRFRGPAGNSIVENATLPTEWAEDSHVAWKVKIPGRGWSQPVVAGDRVFGSVLI